MGGDAGSGTASTSSMLGSILSSFPLFSIVLFRNSVVLGTIDEKQSDLLC